MNEYYNVHKLIDIERMGHEVLTRRNISLLLIACHLTSSRLETFLCSGDNICISSSVIDIIVL